MEQPKLAHATHPAVNRSKRHKTGVFALTKPGWELILLTEFFTTVNP